MKKRRRQALFGLALSLVLSAVSSAPADASGLSQEAPRQEPVAYQAISLTGGGVIVDFVDDDNSVFEADIEWLAAEGITSGCAKDRFCPDDPVTRGQMAAFLVRALDLKGLSPQGDIGTPCAVVFSDVDCNNTFNFDVAKLAGHGITSGCTDTTFCPDDPVTRDQMAAFLVRAYGIAVGPLPPEEEERLNFVDDDGSVFEADIRALAFSGITSGCAEDRFCPDDPVTRGQMAAFLRRAAESVGKG